ncbi:ubiquitin carboxyl-terminal hydrolase 47-like [Mustelus asterias]
MGKSSRQPPGDSPETFIGLKNQGATCYLNTLLQTLYMTPEVKEAIIRFVEKTDEKIDKDTSICYQLKVLFAALDANHTANTYGITRNLGMNEQDVFKQQDVEEYFRRLLNKVATESDGSCNVLQIYQSKVINSLKCLKCKTETPEECILLDVPLSIRSFDHSNCFNSVNESLEEFLRVTTLSGDNLCYCETCDEKTETETRYYFESLPKILVLQLKRFEFDYTVMRFTKLHDFLEIPMKLTFQKKKIKDTDITEWYLLPMESRKAARTNLTDLQPSPSKRSKNAESEERQEQLKDERQEEYTTYELLAICDHSGGYGSGHYIAYIKPGSSSNWYSFNDINVKEIKDFIPGECTDSTGDTAYIRSDTAYMLMYRKANVNNYLGENADEEKQSNKPMALGNRNGNDELGRMGDGAHNNSLRQSQQIADRNTENASKRNTSRVTRSNEKMGQTKPCETKEIKRQTQEVDMRVEKEKSTEEGEMATGEKIPAEQRQVDRKESIRIEKDTERQQRDSKREVENEIGMEKANKNFTRRISGPKKNKLPSVSEEKLIISEKGSQEEVLLETTKEKEKLREQTCREMGPKGKNEFESRKTETRITKPIGCLSYFMMIFSSRKK